MTNEINSVTSQRVNDVYGISKKHYEPGKEYHPLKKDAPPQFVTRAEVDELILQAKNDVKRDLVSAAKKTADGGILLGSLDFFDTFAHKIKKTMTKD